jgi:hypothetical protein
MADTDRDTDAGHFDDMFRFFVMQNQMTAMIYLGKVVHPATGQLERNLDGARLTIDILGMLEEKTRGNLTPDEARLLEQTLTNLRLNFVDEMRKDSGRPAESKKPAPEESGSVEKESENVRGESADMNEKTAGDDEPRTP